MCACSELAIETAGGRASAPTSVIALPVRLRTQPVQEATTWPDLVVQTAPSATPELRMSRIFDAQKRLVFEAWNKANVNS